jgi:iron complex outermembrane receptor protein
VRLASASGQPLEWVVGGFYTREDFTGGQVLLSLDLAGQPLANNLYVYRLPSLYQEYAGFGTVTWHFTDKFDVSGGLRYAHNSQEKQVIGTGTIGSSLNDPLRKSDDDVLTYLANARYHFNDRVTAYVRYATGYKAGGPNAVVIDAATGEVLSPDTLQAETLDSYEIGIKGHTAERLFSFDAAAFYTNWEDIQVSTTRGTPGVGVYLNTPGARVRGGELTLALRPLQALTLAGAFAYTDAQLTEPAPDLRGVKGERLPNVPRFTAAVSADYAFASSLQPTLGLSMRHVSDRMASYNANTSNRQYRLPDYEALDLRAGLVLGAVDVQLYVRNLLDERGQLSAYTFQGFPQVAILQPRTFGLNLTTRF